MNEEHEEQMNEEMKNKWMKNMKNKWMKNMKKIGVEMHSNRSIAQGEAKVVH